MPEGEEKSFPATPQRRQEARKKGQVARSAEFGAAATLLALVIALHALLPGQAGLSLLRDLQAAFRFNPHDSDFTFATVQQWQMRGIGWAASLLLPAGLLAVALSLAAGIGQVGFAVTPEALAPQWNRLNPAAGFKRLVSLRGSVEAIKGLLKMALVGGICYSTLRRCGGIGRSASDHADVPARSYWNRRQSHLDARPARQRCPADFGCRRLRVSKVRI